MKRLFLVAALVLVAGCKGSEKAAAPPPAEPAIPLAKTYPVEEPRPALAPPPGPSFAELAAEVEADLRAANRLEADLYRSAGATSRAEVLAHYERGYGTEIAGRMSALAWQDGKLTRGTYRLTYPIEGAITVLRLEGNAAQAYYATPQPLQAEWGLGPWTLVDLRREGNRWIIVDQNPSDTPPR